MSLSLSLGLSRCHWVRICGSFGRTSKINRTTQASKAGIWAMLLGITSLSKMGSTCEQFCNYKGGPIGKTQAGRCGPGNRMHALKSCFLARDLYATCASSPKKEEALQEGEQKEVSMMLLGMWVTSSALDLIGVHSIHLLFSSQKGGKHLKFHLRSHQHFIRECQWALRQVEINFRKVMVSSHFVNRPPGAQVSLQPHLHPDVHPSSLR